MLLNGLGPLTGEFLKLLLDIKFDQELRAVVVRSTSAKAFCTGADLKERAGMSPEEVGPFVATLRRMVRDFYDLPVPTIAAIDGFALGGGLEFALSADMRYSSARFNLF